MKLTVNGVDYELASPPLASLLHALREELGITSAKAGCEQGGCGACTVLVEGEPRRSCLVPLASLDGASITTVEGIGSPERLAPVQAAFYRGYAAQCGFCTSGFVLAAHALLQRNGAPTREEILENLGGHICRCTGYVKIVDAIEAAARGEVDTAVEMPAPQPEEPEVAVPGAPA